MGLPQVVQPDPRDARVLQNRAEATEAVRADLRRSVVEAVKLAWRYGDAKEDERQAAAAIIGAVASLCGRSPAWTGATPRRMHREVTLPRK
jgi:hypothetical protein